MIPAGWFNRAWVASAGYQGTAVVGGIMLMFRRMTNWGVRVGTCGIGLTMIFTCLLLVRNVFGLAFLSGLGAFLVAAGWRLPPFWVGEVYALLAATTCLNAITSIRVLFFVTTTEVGGVVRESDATTMQSITLIHSWIWASAWMALAFWMTCMGIFITFEPKGGDGSQHLVETCREEDHPLALSTELA